MTRWYSRGRTVYAREGEGQRDGPILGVMDDADLAAHVVEAHNRPLDDAQEALDPVTEELRERAAEVVERACRMMDSYSVPRAAQEAKSELRATMLQLIDLASRHGSDAADGPAASPT